MVFGNRQKFREGFIQNMNSPNYTCLSDPLEPDDLEILPFRLRDVSYVCKYCFSEFVIPSIVIAGLFTTGYAYFSNQSKPDTLPSHEVRTTDSVKSLEGSVSH